MSEENVEIVRRIVDSFFGALARGDPAAAWDPTLYAPDMELIPAPEVSGAQSYRGFDGLLEFMRVWTEDFEDWSVEYERLIEAPDDRVVGLAYQSGKGKESGVPVELRFGQIFELVDGKVTRMRLYIDPADALEAAGLAE